MTATRLLRHPSDWRSMLVVLIALSLMAVQWSGLLRHPLLYLTGLCLAFICCVVDHNHQHLKTFRVDSANRLFGVLVTWAIGQPASAIVPMHNSNHHVYNNHDEDHLRASIVSFRWNALNLLAFPFVALRDYLRLS